MNERREKLTDDLRCVFYGALRQASERSAPPGTGLVERGVSAGKCASHIGRPDSNDSPLESGRLHMQGVRMDAFWRFTESGGKARIALLNTHFSFFARSLMATPCQPVKKVLTSWQTGEQAPSPLPPLSFFSEIFQISGWKNCNKTIFAPENRIFRRFQSSRTRRIRRRI